MRPRWVWVVPVVAAIVASTAAAGALTLTTNEREVPIQQVDLDAANGYSAALESVRIGKLARSWDELMTMPPPGALGGPRTDLTWRALIDFADGRRAFRRTFTKTDGLGPGFNDTSCAGCHSHPNQGGAGKDLTAAVATVAPPDDPKDTVGTQKHRNDGKKAPNLANLPMRRTPALYGIGLLDAVPDKFLRALADPTDANKDGISGILNERGHPAGGLRPARFGHKANEPNLLRFIGAALMGEMGITNRASRARPRDQDRVADPEAPPGYVARVDAYVRGLAPPRRAPASAAAQRGELLFGTLGCTGCHRPELGVVQGAYTDLLIHDLGPAVSDGLYDGKAGPTSWRTPALWGLRFKRRYLHDERAATIDEVLAFHGGEAATASGRFRGLSATDRAAVTAFLRSL